MAVNLYPWVRNDFGATKPLIVRFPVQAGSTQEIVRGEICDLNETSGYMAPVDAVADGNLYKLAFSNEEQKAADLAERLDAYLVQVDAQRPSTNPDYDPSSDPGRASRPRGRNRGWARPALRR